MRFPGESELQRLKALLVDTPPVPVGPIEGAWFCGACGAQGSFLIAQGHGIVSQCTTCLSWPEKGRIAARRKAAGIDPANVG